MEQGKGEMIKNTYKWLTPWPDADRTRGGGAFPWPWLPTGCIEMAAAAAAAAAAALL